jgi:hypothetical protein
LGAGAGLLAAPGALDEGGAFRSSIGPSINWGTFNLGQVRARIRASDAASEPVSTHGVSRLLKFACGSPSAFSQFCPTSQDSAA